MSIYEGNLQNYNEDQMVLLLNDLPTINSFEDDRLKFGLYFY